MKRVNIVGALWKCLINEHHEDPIFFIIKSFLSRAIWTLTQKNLTLLHANKKGTDQHSLISAFVILYLESIVVNLAPCKISIF